MSSTAPVESIPGLLETDRLGEGATRLLIEVPHGATERAHYDALAARLESPLPARLEQFFHVNTDFGAPELARRVATLVAGAAREGAGRGVAVVRALVPRTFVDLNREIGESTEPGMTPGLPPYIVAERDRDLLLNLHREYASRVAALYEQVMAAGGLAVALHTYAPRSVDVAVDADIVGTLRAAYRPERYATWKVRPPVDFITRDAAGTDLSPRALVAELRGRYASIGVETGENATYHLHPATMGHRFASTWPGRVLCVEYRRDLLGAPWRPFTPSPTGPRKVARLANPLAAALRNVLDDPRP